MFDVLGIDCKRLELICFNVVVEENLLMFPSLCCNRRLFC